MTIRNVRTFFDPGEARRDRRYPIPSVVVTIAEKETVARNWSLSGLQIDRGDLTAETGAEITGAFRVDDGPRSYEFTAEVVRVDDPPGTLSLHFTQLPPGAVDDLDKALARRIAGRPRKSEG